jgi:hypothetical protein
MTLSEKQLEQIRKEVDKSNLSIVTLKDDLLDHLCSEIETKMEAGKSFEATFMEALHELAPEGLRQIEIETMTLLNSKKYIPMKMIMFLIGCVCSMCISMGWLLKFLNFAPVGNMLFGLGSFVFLIVFLPMLAIYHFRSADKSTSEKIRFVTGISSIIIVGIAILARLMRMPGANEVMIIGLVIFTFGFLPFLFFTMYKKSVIA